MKNFNTVLLIAATFFTTFFSSCTKEEEVKPDPTRLQITVRDELGNAVSGTTVKLYASQADWENETNQVGSTQVSDASGNVTFSDLSNIKYYWFAEKDCKNNYHGSAMVVNPLTSNTTTTVNTVLSSTGTILLQNTSTNPYTIFIDGEEILDLNGKTSQYIYYVASGSHSIRVLQKSGYAVYPTDETYTGTITCGATLSVTFPQ